MKMVLSKSLASGTLAGIALFAGAGLAQVPLPQCDQGCKKILWPQGGLHELR
jgi:hypothetical protein